jgi:hypothetical protein
VRIVNGLLSHAENVTQVAEEFKVLVDAISGEETAGSSQPLRDYSE